MLKNLSQMTAGDQFWFPVNVAEAVSTRFIGEFPEGFAIRTDGELNCQHIQEDRLFEMAR